MIFIGDVHGKTGKLTHKLLGPAFKDKKGFQVGDMGLGFPGVQLRTFPTKYFQFIRGNHDAPQKCRQHPNYAGDYGYDPEEKLFYLGGAWSIDAAWRIEGISWWKDEELDLVELNKAQQLYLESKPQIVATHEAPTAAAIILLNQVMFQGRPDLGDNPVRVSRDSSYEYYREKVGCKNTRTSQALQQMLEMWSPKHWVFGHYHVRMDFELYGCKFHCIPELDTLEITDADL